MINELLPKILNNNELKQKKILKTKKTPKLLTQEVDPLANINSLFFRQG